MTNLPLIVGYGGINAGGRSIFDFSHQRMVFDDIDSNQQKEVLLSLGHLMDTNDVDTILDKSLIATNCHVALVSEDGPNRMIWLRNVNDEKKWSVAKIYKKNEKKDI